MRLNYKIDMDEDSVWMIVTVDGEAKAQLPYVQELGDFHAHAKYYTERSGLPSYLIMCTVNGEGTLQYNGETLRVPAGHFFWIDCMEPQFHYTSPDAGSWHAVWVHLYGSGCTYCYDCFRRANGGRVDGVLPAGSNVTDTIYELMRLYGSPQVDTEIHAASLLSSIMYECIASCGNVSASAGSDLPEYVVKIRDCLLSDYRSRLTLDVLSQRFALNKFYLQKLFKTHIGLSPADYLTKVRIGHAKELLRTTDQPVAAVAADVGIENTSHFIRLFTHEEGLTPGAFRKRWS